MSALLRLEKRGAGFDLVLILQDDKGERWRRLASGIRNRASFARHEMQIISAALILAGYAVSTE